MNTATDTAAPGSEEFLAILDAMASSLNWRVRSFERGDSVVAVVALNDDPHFEQVVWVYDTQRVFVRCLLATRGNIPEKQVGAIVELCAYINDGLIYGCAEYSFSDRVLAFRDSVSLEYGDTAAVLTDLSQRVFTLGSHYANAVAAVLAGASAVEAMKQ